MEFTIILLAMVAAFLGLRLYSVLGKRTGHEQDVFQASADKSASVREIAPVTIDTSPATASALTILDTQAENGLRQIMSADRGFSAADFVENAKTAYHMILEAYWSGNKANLRDLTDDSVYASFAEAIDAREAAGETLENRLIRFNGTQIVDAVMHNNEAEITLRFDADIAALVRDKDGQVIGGSLSDAVETHDEWTFARNMASGSPAWVLISTDQD